MGDSPTVIPPNGKKAAVVVIDNQFGLLGGAIPADSANEVWSQVTAGLFTQHYDEVVIVTGHYTDLADNPIVSALQQETSRFGRVDMFTNMHTNMIRSENMLSLSMERSLAQLPFKIWTEALNADQRSHLRLLYSMGCDDGNEIAANAAHELGFKTYVGHEGSASNVIATYPLVARWMRGVPIREAASQTNAEIEHCLPQVGETLEKHKAEIKSALTTFLDCNRAAGGGKKTIFLNMDTGTTQIKTNSRDEKTAAACLDAVASALTPIGMETALTTASCISTAREVFGHIQTPGETARGLFESAKGKLAMVAGYKNDTVLKEILPEDFKEKLIEEAKRMHLVVYGADIGFEDTPQPVLPLARDEEVKQLVAFVMGDAAEKGFSMKKTMLAAAALDRLQELGAKRELSSIAADKRVQPGMHLETARRLAKLGDLSALRKMAFEEGGNEYVCELLYDFGDKNYLRTLLHDVKTPATLRKILAGLFTDKGEFDAIKGLGHFFEKHGAGGVSMEKIWDRAKQDTVFAKDYRTEIISILSSEHAWVFGDTSIYFEMVDKDPQLLVKASGKIAACVAAQRGAVKDFQWETKVEFMLFAITLLFEKGKISASDARGLLARSKISKKDIIRFADMGTIDTFDPAPVVRKLYESR